MLKKRQMSGVFDWFRKPAPGPTPSAVPALPIPAGIPADVDLYAVFGISPGASMDEIRRAYRDQARKFHPDLNPNDPVAARMFRQLSDYYGILEDPERRATYDRARAAYVQRQAPEAAPPPPPPPPAAQYPMVIQPQAPEETPYGRRPAVPPPVQPQPPVPSRGIPGPWETMFGPPEEIPSFMDVPYGEPREPVQTYPPTFQRPPAPPPAYVQPPPPPPMLVQPPGSRLPAPSETQLPTVQEIAQMIYYTWPLDQIWGIVRAERNSASFRHSGIMQVDQVAGFGPESVEYELGESLGIPPWFVQQYMQQGRAGFEALWNQIYAPMFQRVTAAMELLKPQDIRGKFGLDVDQRGSRVDLLYSERP